MKPPLESTQLSNGVKQNLLPKKQRNDMNEVIQPMGVKE
jgi:hypothetical protein